MAKLAVTIDKKIFDVELILAPHCEDSCQVRVDGQLFSVVVPGQKQPSGQLEWIIVDERPYELAHDESQQWIIAYSGLHRVKVQDQDVAAPLPRSSDGRVKAPIPGLISRVLVKEGQQVKADQPLLVLEAMKMENEIRAPLDGRVESLAIRSGQTVAQNDLLIRLGRSHEGVAG